MSWSVQLGVLETVDIVDVLIEDTQRQDGQRRIEQVVHGDEHRIEYRLHNITISSGDKRVSFVFLSFFFYLESRLQRFNRSRIRFISLCVCVCDNYFQVGVGVYLEGGGVERGVYSTLEVSTTDATYPAYAW